MAPIPYLHGQNIITLMGFSVLSLSLHLILFFGLLFLGLYLVITVP